MSSCCLELRKALPAFIASSRACSHRTVATGSEREVGLVPGEVEGRLGLRGDTGIYKYMEL